MRESRIEKDRIHVMSYNLLCEQWATQEKHIYSPQSMLDFSFRAPRII